jgi:hypothetical protein
LADLASLIQDSVIGLIHPAVTVAYPSLGLAYENAPFDRNNPPPLWAEIDFHYTNASQIGPSGNPKTRQRGFVYVCVYAREGTGTKATTDVLGWFRKQLGYATPGPVRLQAPQIVSEPGVKGWHLRSIKVEFHADEA